MANYFEDAPLIQQPRNNNRLLIEDPSMEEEEKESGFLRAGGMGSQMSGFGMPQKRNLAPLIEEEDDAAPVSAASKEDLAWSLGLPKLQQQKRNRDARRAYNTLMHNKASANPWTKTGQRTQANVAGMFGERSAKIPFFDKLFGRPASNFRSGERADRRDAELAATGKTVGNQTVEAPGIMGAFRRFKWRMTNRFRSNDRLGGKVGTREQVIGPKMSWMQRLFGARRPKAETAKAMGIKSPKGRWADQLIDKGEQGLLGEGAENFSGPVEEEKQGQEPAHQSFEHYRGSEESEEEKVPVNKPMNLGYLQAALANQKAMAAAHQSNEYGAPQQNEYGDENGTVDDNSIDNDDDKDDDKDVYDKGMLQAYMNKNDDDEASEDDDESVENDVVQKFIMNNMFMK